MSSSQRIVEMVFVGRSINDFVSGGKPAPSNLVNCLSEAVGLITHDSEFEATAISMFYNFFKVLGHLLTISFVVIGIEMTYHRYFGGRRRP